MLYGMCGNLEVFKDKSSFRLSYAGNMGATEASVAKCVDALYGKGAFKKLKKVGEFAKDKYSTYSDPSQIYILVVPKAKFLEIVLDIR